jgi:hypothetical protein
MSGCLRRIPKFPVVQPVNEHRFLIDFSHELLLEDFRAKKWGSILFLQLLQQERARPCPLDSGTYLHILPYAGNRQDE